MRRLAVEGQRNHEAAREAARPGDQDQCDRRVLPPAQSADVGVAHEPAVRPDAFPVEPAANAPTQRRSIAVVDKHHGLAERVDRRALLNDQLDDDEQSQRAGESGEEHGVRRPAGWPGQDRRRAQPPEPDVLHEQADVRDKEPRTQRNEHTREELLHPFILTRRLQAH